MAVFYVNPWVRSDVRFHEDHPDSVVIPDLPECCVVLAAVKHAARRYAVAFGHA